MKTRVIRILLAVAAFAALVYTLGAPYHEAN